MKVQPPPLEIDAPGVVEQDRQLGRDLEVRKTVSDGRLSLVPIVTRDLPEPTTRYITLQAGLASGQVIANDTGVVETISITNRAREPLAILGGELVIGGEQDRLVVHDAVVPAGKTFALTVVCAEPGRMWGGPQFRASHTLAEPTLRKLARNSDQLQVWDRIRSLGGTDYRDAFAQQRSGVHADRLRHLLAELDRVDRREERSQTVGFAVAIDHRVVAIEHFASPALYRDLRTQVIASYLPGSGGKPRPTEIEIGAREVRAFREKTGEGDPVPPRSPVVARSAARSVDL